MINQNEIIKKYELTVGRLNQIKFGHKYKNPNGKEYVYKSLLTEHKDFVYKRGRVFFTESGVKKIEKYKESKNKKDVFLSYKKSKLTELTALKENLNNAKIAYKLKLDEVKSMKKKIK